MVPHTLSNAECRSFLDHGYVQRPGLVPASLVEAARKAIDIDLAADRSLGHMPKYLGDSFCPGLLSDPKIRDLYDASPVRDIVADLFGPDRTLTHEAQIAVRFPEYTDQPKSHPPHIDGFPSTYNTVTPGTVYRQNLLVGVYLSRIEQNNMGNFVVWGGSHRRVADIYRSLDVTRLLAEHAPAELMKRLIPPDLDEGTQIIAEPGDVVLAHGGLVHSAASNLSLQLRYAVYFRVNLTADDFTDPRGFGEPMRYFDRIANRRGVRLSD